jgi:cellulose biosynthesis protein BcsQ
MKSVAFFNNKGGVGKTTLLCNVAAYAALFLEKKVCVIDADPQCNATQYFFSEEELESLYKGNKTFKISSAVNTLKNAEGYVRDVSTTRASNFGLDVIIGDPEFALSEDFLAQDWGQAKGGEIRGVKTNLVFADLFSKLEQYDLVFVDVSPSLGAINRAILLSCDYFVSPMSIDIFSLKAFENIAKWMTEWADDWTGALGRIKEPSSIPNLKNNQVKFLGYVTQQYLARKDSSGQRRGVAAYDSIISQIVEVIKRCGLDKNIPTTPFEIGTVPNLFSLIPMSQSSNKPVFSLVSSDGIVGAHFAKVTETKAIFGDVTKSLLERM